MTCPGTQCASFNGRGRIDRIGSDADVVHIYNFFPEDKLESLLNLVERLHEKIV
ncbi:unnamed protein product, partial [marine sediment metagenome]